jgi:hypothetical protein
MSTPEETPSERFQRTLERLAELMPPDQLAQVVQRIDWALDASLAGASEEDIAAALRAGTAPGRC